MSAKYIVIIPYYSEEEIDRYLLIADRLQQFGKQNCDYEFLLAASPKIKPSYRLLEGFAKLAPTRHFACPTQIFGYPEGTTAMFWDCMDELARSGEEGGFGLWLESDMVPVKQNWLEHIVAEWNRADDPLMMGLYVPSIVKKRFLKRNKVWLSEHANGGGCYATNFGREIPKVYREKGTFDVVCYEFLRDHNLFAATQAFGFSTVEGCRRDMANPEKMILHGFLQDKNQFVDNCIRPLENHEQQFQERPIQAKQGLVERLGSRFIKRERGHAALLNRLISEQELLWHTGKIGEISVASRSVVAMSTSQRGAA